MEKCKNRVPADEQQQYEYCKMQGQGPT
nr:omega-ORF; evidence of in vivo translation but product apparently does not survive for any time; no product detected in vivo [Drosophila melanogaster]